MGPVYDRDPEALVWRRDTTLNPGGLLYDDGVHKYAVALYWIGEIERIVSMVNRSDEFMMEAPSAAIWSFKDRNCLGVLDYSSSPHMVIRAKYVPVDEFFEIHGSHGVMWVTRCSGEMYDLPPVMVFKGAETQSYQVPMDWRVSFDGAAADFIDSPDCRPAASPRRADVEDHPADCPCHLRGGAHGAAREARRCAVTRLSAPGSSFRRKPESSDLELATNMKRRRSVWTLPL